MLNSSANDKSLAFMPVEEQALLQDAVARLLDGAEAAGNWRNLWSRLVAMGGLAVALPVDQGGLDDAGAVRVIATELGRRAIALPFACGVAATLRALARMPAPPAALPALAAGECLATLAIHEVDTLPQLLAPQTLARRHLDGYHLTGRKQAVPFGAEADYILLPAWLDAENQLGLFLVRQHDEGLQASPATGIDAACYADLDLVNVAAELLCQGEAAQDMAEWLFDAYGAALCAEAAGAMRHLVDATAAYLGIRQQFGMALSVNQALRHRFVDIDVQLTQAEAAADWAASALDNETDPVQRRRALLSARFTCTRAAWRVSQEAVQMHGGMGMAAETGLGAYMRRLLAITLLFGDEDSLAEAFAAA